MAGLKEIRNRITSIASTMQITSAMKMVSAAKLKKAHDAVIALNPYSDKINQIIKNITYGEGNVGNAYTVERPVKNLLIVAITSNRGLCGAFNSNIIKEVLKLEKEHGDYKVSIVAIGKKGHDVLKRTCDIHYFNDEVFDNLNFENSEIIVNKIMYGFLEEKFDKVLLVYNHSKNAATQIIITSHFLPVLPKKNDESVVANNDYIFEPSKSEVLESLIPKALKIEFYRALRNSFEGEHGARMTAMYKATDNAQELKNELTLKYNKERQAAITGEILEIVGGAEALKS